MVQAKPWYTFLYDSEEGTVLGRTASSWGKILLFYAVYYSFLALLFWGFLAAYKSTWVTIPGGTRPTVHTRQGQPGIAAHPFSTVDPKFKGSQQRASISLKDAKAQDDYVKMLKAFRDSHETAGVDCTDKVTAKDNTCKLDLAELSDEQITASVQNKEPLVAFDVNKVFNWKPINVGNVPNEGKRNAVYFKCVEIDGKNEQPLKSSKHSIEWVGNEYITENHYPYTGTFKNKDGDKVGNGEIYNKPFVLGKVKGLVAGAEASFRCKVLVDNIAQVRDNDDKFNMDLDALGVGSIKFTVGY